MKDDGGPAFPVMNEGALLAIGLDAVKDIPKEKTDERDAVFTEAKAKASRGMSLRDWFAGMALQGIIGPAVVDAARNRTKPDSIPPKMADGAYALADAMLAARKEQQ